MSQEATLTFALCYFCSFLYLKYANHDSLIQVHVSVGQNLKFENHWFRTSTLTFYWVGTEEGTLLGNHVSILDILMSVLNRYIWLSWVSSLATGKV